MASGLFIVVVLIFVLRGMFLGLSGVIGRLLGFVLAYYFAYNYRSQVANLIEQNTAIQLPNAVLEILAGVVIFVGIMFITGLLVSLLFKLTAKFIPALRQLADKKSGAAMVTGALVNGCFGAAIALMVMWGIGVATKKPADTPLQTVANSFGSKVFSLINENSDLDIQTNSMSITSYSQTSNATNTTSTGSATITSSSDPTKTLSIDTAEKIITEAAINQGLQLDPAKLLANEQVQSMLNNPEIRNQLMQQLQDNPEKIQQLLENPQLQGLLKQFQDSPNNE